MLLIRIFGEDASEGGDHTHASRPQWMRILAMEIMRG